MRTAPRMRELESCRQAAQGRPRPLYSIGLPLCGKQPAGSQPVLPCAQYLTPHTPNSRAPLCRQDRSQLSGPETSTGGNGGAGGRLPPPGSSGGAGAGGWGEGASEPEPEVSQGIRWQGWQDRVQADPQFVYKVIVEQVRRPPCAASHTQPTRRRRARRLWKTSDSESSTCCAVVRCAALRVLISVFVP